MNKTKFFSLIVIVFLSIIALGSISLAQQINDRLHENFQNALTHAKIFREVLASDLDKPIEVVLTVYEQPIEIDYLYGSMDEVDFTTPEGIFLSLISCTTVEW